MALAWEPFPKAKHGHEREFEELFEKLEATMGPRRARLLEWFANLSEPAFALLDAPRVGYDAAADAWLAARVEKQRRTTSLDEIKRDMHGYYVLQLLPPCDGFPVYSTYLTTDGLERYAFDAARLLTEAHEIIGDHLARVATFEMMPATLAAYAERLHEAAQRFSVDNDLPGHVETIREPMFPAGTAAGRCHLVFAAAKWATFWSHRGHGLMPISD
ncbi:MAG: hypothetical protein SFX73_27380 [Kofleriaceae bacterium]|nr:hypothetical protein [Kofleriaceae bacterium]